jgi:hypothetical protein
MTASVVYRSRGPGSIPAPPDFLRSSGFGTGPTQPSEYTRGVNGVICVAEKYCVSSELLNFIEFLNIS